MGGGGAGQNVEGHKIESFCVGVQSPTAYMGEVSRSARGEGAVAAALVTSSETTSRRGFLLPCTSSICDSN